MDMQAFIKTAWEWTCENKKWVFSGIGVAIISCPVMFFLHKKVADKNMRIATVEKVKADRGSSVNVAIDQSKGLDGSDMEGIIASFMDKHGQTARELGRADEQINSLKKELAAAVERIKELKAEGNRPDAEKALRELRESGDMSRLQELLIKDRDERRDALIQRNREIAAVAYLRGDINVAMEAIDEILKLLPDDVDAVNRKGHILKLRGKLIEAEKVYQRVLEIGEQEKSEAWQAVALGNLGLVYWMRGELDRAEKVYLKSLEISEPRGLLELTANQYGNLGVIYETWGELERAEEMHKKALEIDKKIGRLEGQAIRYGNLGLIYRMRGELEKAEEMYKKSLEIAEKLGHLEYMASDYAGLGLVYYARGDYGKAEEWHQKGLDIEEKLGRLEGMARQYGNLGVVYKERGDVGKAREYWEKAVGLYEKIGMPHMVEKVKGWMGQAFGLRE